MPRPVVSIEVISSKYTDVVRVPLLKKWSCSWAGALLGGKIGLLQLRSYTVPYTVMSPLGFWLGSLSLSVRRSRFLTSGASSCGRMSCVGNTANVVEPKLL